MSTDFSNLINTKTIKRGTKCAAAFEFIFETVRCADYSSPSAMVDALCTRYESYTKKTNSTNGKVFEAVLATVLLKHGVYPLFVQAKVVFVPNVNFDFILYAEEFGPISISAKTSLRERYKQADLEAVSLKYVHRKAKCFLVTLHKEEANNLSKKVKNSEMLGIDEVILATSLDFDNLIVRLQTMRFIKPVAVEVITATKVLTA